MLMEIDHAKIPNMSNLAPEFMDASFDPGWGYALPYTWGLIGVGYRKSAVDGVPDSWQQIFDSDQYSGRIALLGESADLCRIGAKYLGHSVVGVTPETLADVEAMFIRQKPHIRVFHEDNGQDLLLAGDVDLVMEYNGDIAQIMQEDDDIDFVVPREGTLLNTDCLCIPAGAPHPDNAHSLINFVLDAMAGAEIAETILYPTPNAAARALMPPSYSANPAIFPPAERMAVSEYGAFEGPEITQAFEEAMTRIRAA
jgi:spermidine/putrescine transport system substrate-binding protein